MRPVRILNLAVCTIIICSGCATFKAIPSKMKAFVMREPAGEDRLLADASVSKEFQTAKKELKDADATVRQFAYMCESRGDFAKAKECYQDLLGDNPENVEARLGIARVEFATGRKAEAEDILRTAARKHPDSARVWMEMGRVQTARDQWGAAAVSLEKAAKLEPNNQQVRYELGLALARSNRLEEAVPHLKQAGGESAAFYNIAFVLKEAGRTGEARFWTRRALNSYPDERTKRMAEQMLASLSTPGQQPNANSETQLAQGRVIPGKTKVEAYKETPKDWRQEAAPQAPQNPGIANRTVVAAANSATTSGSPLNYDGLTIDANSRAPRPGTNSANVGVSANAIHQTSFTPSQPPSQNFANAAPRIIRQPVETMSVHSGKSTGNSPGVVRLPTWNGPTAPASQAPAIGNTTTVDPPMWGTR